MNDFRRTILWVVLIAAIFLLFNRWIQTNRPVQEQITQQQPTDSSVKSTTLPQSLPSTIKVDDTSNLAETPSNNKAVSQDQVIELTTDVLKLKFNEKEANIIFSELLKYKASATEQNAEESKNVVLFNNNNARVYKEQSGLLGEDYAKISYSMHLTTPIEQLNAQRDSWQVSFISDPVNNVKLQRTYFIKRGSYDILVENKVINLGNNPLQIELFYQIIRDAVVHKESKLYWTFTGFATYTEANKFSKVAFDDITNRSVKLPSPANDGFIAMIQHYFTSAWIGAKDAPRRFFAQKYGNELYAMGMIESLPTIAANSEYVSSSTLYVGPQIEKDLAKLAPGLEAVKDYGMFTFLSRPTYWVIVKLHEYLKNWGWSIVAFVFLLKIVFYYLNARAYSSMARMRAVQPRVTKLRETYKDNPQKMQQEMMRIYREEKVNPVGGCLPILLQMPFFIALYWVLLSSAEFRGAPWILWVQDLSRPDPYFILPLLMAATTFLQTWLNPKPADPVQAKVMWIMPIVFSVMFAFFPSGLVLYWFVNNLLAIAQQWVITKRLMLKD